MLVRVVWPDMRRNALAVPWLTKLATAVLRGRLEQEQDALARDAVRNLERLGPTFLKLGQVLSIRWVLAPRRIRMLIVVMCCAGQIFCRQHMFLCRGVHPLLHCTMRPLVDISPQHRQQQSAVSTADPPDL